MKLNVCAFANAVAIVWTALFVLCRAVFVIAPKESMAFLGYVTHSDLSTIAQPVTWGGFCLGLVVVYLLAALTAGTAASLYNRFVFAAGTDDALEGRRSEGLGPLVGGLKS